MMTNKADSDPVLSSFGGPNLWCVTCGKSFYSESAADMAGRPCGTAECAGSLDVLGGGSKTLREA